jgi:hypothetical protein
MKNIIRLVVQISLLCSALAVALSLLAPTARAGELRAGAARVDVSPSQPVLMAGYGARTEPSTGIHDPISARALVFEQDGARVALVSLDNCGFYNRTAPPLRDAICQATGLKPSELLLCAIHDHSAPTLTLDPAHGGAANVEYTKDLQTKLASVVKTALERLAPVKIGTGSGSSPLAICRREQVLDKAGKPRIVLGRNPSFVLDREVQVLKVMPTQGTDVTAALFDYACHSVALGQNNRLISGDIHGMAAQFMEDYLGAGAVAPAFAGASGDINPWIAVVSTFRTDKGWVPEPILMADLLGEEIATVCDKISPTNTSCLIKSSLKTLDLERKPAASFAANLETETDAFTITVARVGDIAFVGWGGEMFNDFGKTVKNYSPFRTTFIMTHCNGAAGYFPTKESFPAGGYEVESTQFAKGAGEKIVAETLRMLDELQ